MKLIRLTLHNFMAYKGTHEIDFDVSENAPIILFLGENGHGKSTIQHAARWCLYDKTSDRNLVIPVKDLLNRKAANGSQGDRDAEMSVEIVWSDAGREYDLLRTWTSESKNGESHAVLRIEGGNPVPESSIPEYVQRFLAKEISHFFFFNGEVQDEFDDMVSNARSATFIRNEIEKTLSIPVIADGIDWLNEKKKQENAAIVKANRNNQKIAEAATSFANEEIVHDALVEEMNNCQVQLNDAISRIRILEEEVGNIEEVQSLAGDISFLSGKRASLLNERRDKLAEIREILSRNPWIPDARQLLEMQRENERSISEAARLSNDVLLARNEIALLERLKTQDTCPICRSRHDATPADIVDRINVLNNTIDSIALTDIEVLEERRSFMNALHLRGSVHTNVRNLKKDFDSLGSDLSKTEQSLSEKRRELDLHGNIDVKNVVMSMKGLAADKTNAEVGLSDYRLRIEESKKTMARLQSEIGKGQGVSPEKQIASAAYSYLADLFEVGKDKYTDAVKKRVQEYASETFLKIISDKKYKGLRINDNYGVDLIMENDEIDSLRSTGQGKVSTISLVSGLIKTAMPEGFILMDTPFVSLDKGHREQVCRWAATCDLYVSLFMHSGEFRDDSLMEFFEGRVGRIYRIRQVDLNESTIQVEV
jgi:DNA sulfur modification protein DndD